MDFSGVLKDLLGGMGAASFDWRSGSTGEVKTLKDLAKGLDSVFGKLDADEVTDAVAENLRNKFHSDSRYDISDVSYWDKEIILRYCKSMLSGTDKKKISKADLSICVKILKNAKTAPSEKDVSGWTDAEKVFKPSIIAQVVNDSIKGFFKKATRGVSEKDIVLIKNYDDNIKPSADDKKLKDYEGFDSEGNGEGETADDGADLEESSSSVRLMRFLFEEGEDEKPSEEKPSEEKKDEKPSEEKPSEEGDEEDDEEDGDEDDGGVSDDKYKQHLVSVLKSDKQFVKKVADVKEDFGKGEKIKDDIKLDEKTTFKAGTDYTKDAVVKILDAGVKANKIDKYVNDYLTPGVVKKLFGSMHVSDDDVKKSSTDREYEQYIMFIVPMPGMRDKKEKKEAS